MSIDQGPALSGPVMESVPVGADQPKVRRSKTSKIPRRNATTAVSHEPGKGGQSRTKTLARLGWYEPLRKPVKTTTVQAAGLHLAIASAPTGPNGLYLGLDTLTRWPVFHDVFAAYGLTISSPNVVVIGDLGSGKSAFVKCWACVRQLMLGRRVVVIDKKIQNGRGEYTTLARALGVEPIRMLLGTKSGGSRINPLDPAISRGSADGSGQISLLRAILVHALGREIKPLEGKALRVAHKSALDRATSMGLVPDIGCVVEYMLEPNPEVAQALRGVMSVETLREWGLEAAFELERLLEDDLAGLIDGPTSGDISLNSALTVFDISMLPEDGPAVPIVMAIIDSWVKGQIARELSPIPTVSIAEEAWYLANSPYGKNMRSDRKVARGTARQNVDVLQHISDIDEGSPAIAAIKESDTIAIFRQSVRTDAEDVVRTFGLPEDLIETIMVLPTGVCLLKIGQQEPIAVYIDRSDIEIELTDTDEAMESTETISNIVHELVRGPS